VSEINLPDNPFAGDTYDFNGVRYTWVSITQLNQPDRGYWRSNVIFNRPFQPIEMRSLGRMVEGLQVDPNSYHYKIFKPDDVGSIKVHGSNFIASPLGILFGGTEITEPGEYYVYGEDSKFFDSDANWKFENDFLPDDVINFTDFVKNCPNYTGEGQIADWNTGNIIKMDSMFEGASSFNADIAPWDVSEVTDMDNMFTNATLFDQDISRWCVRKIVSRPVQFDIGSAFVNQFDLQPEWGKCPRNEDGLNRIGNVTVVGADAVVLNASETYTYTNDGNYKPTDRYSQLDEEWSVDGSYQNTTGIDLSFPPPGRNVPVDCKLTSPFASDSPQIGTKSVYIDGTINSLDINGPSVVKELLMYTYYLDNIVGTGKDLVTYSWHLETTAGNNSNTFIYTDVSPNNDGTIIEAYFSARGTYELCVTTNTDQGFKQSKTVTVDRLPDFQIIGSESTTYGAFEDYYVDVPPEITVLSATLRENVTNSLPFTKTMVSDTQVTYTFGTVPHAQSFMDMKWDIVTPSQTITKSKSVLIGCVRRTVTLRTSTLSRQESIFLGGAAGTDWNLNGSPNFDEADWKDPCCDKVFIIDSNIYGGLFPNGRSLGMGLKYAYPALTVRRELQGSLLIRVESGKTVSGGPGFPQCWNLAGQYGSKFGDFPTTAAYPICGNNILGWNNGQPGGDGLPGIDIWDSTGVTLVNNGTVRGGGGGGTIGGAGGFAATTACASTCTRGGFGGNGNWGVGARNFSENSQWWSSSSSTAKGTSGSSGGGGSSGAGGNGGAGGSAGSKGSNGQTGKSGSNQSGRTCTTVGYPPYDPRPGNAGASIVGSTRSLTFTNNGVLEGEYKEYPDGYRSLEYDVMEYLDTEIEEGRLTRSDAARYLAENHREVYENQKHNLSAPTRVMAEIDSQLRINN